jgi:hypothetical protein
MVVTNMIATMSPAREGSEVHGKLETIPGFQGSVKVAAACARNIHPDVCAAPTDEPVASNTMCATAIVATSIPGRMKGLFERRSKKCNNTATVMAAASFSAIGTFRKASML